MPKIRVLVVDDAVVMRKLISEVLTRDPAIEVAATAGSGSIALQKIPQVNPDIVTLDVEMPDLDGLQTLKEVKRGHPKLPVIMFSSLTAKGAVTTLDALTLGAVDYVTKPANVGSITEGMRRLELDLIPKIKAHCRHLGLNPMAIPAARLAEKIPGVSSVKPRLPACKAIEVVCVGTSTGGPNALAEVFKSFPVHFPVPVVVVQHMPPMFTAMLAERLNHGATLKFHEGQHGQALVPGHVYIAPGGRHMEVKRIAGSVILQLHDGLPENSCRPAVDVLFRSVAAAYGSSALAVIMTGMGHDGLRGCHWLKEHHAQIIAQDEKTSVVWGMPGAVVGEKLADAIVPLQSIREEIVRRVEASRPAHTPVHH